MKINLESVSKAFGYQPVFKDITYSFESGNSYAILGANGSGKSTLVKSIIGYLTPSAGKISWEDENSKSIHPDHYCQYISLVAPYVDVIEELTLKEFLEFHFSFCTVNNTNKVLESTGLSKHQNKSLKLFSSGMKQRVKLASQIYSNKPVIVLDEPTSNLDSEGKEWFQSLMMEIKNNAIILLASNEPSEYNFCDYQLKMEDY